MGRPRTGWPDRRSRRGARPPSVRVSERERPTNVLIENARSSVRNHLDVLDSAFIEATDHSPPSPELDSLPDAGVPTVPDEGFDAALEVLDERRRTSLGLVESDVRDWPS